MVKNIAAYTAPSGSYPPYVSINELETGCVAISVRAAGEPGQEGTFAQVQLWPEEWAKIKRSIAGD